MEGITPHLFACRKKKALGQTLYQGKSNFLFFNLTSRPKHGPTVQANMWPEPTPRSLQSQSRYTCIYRNNLRINSLALHCFSWTIISQVPLQPATRARPNSRSWRLHWFCQVHVHQLITLR